MMAICRCHISRTWPKGRRFCQKSGPAPTNYYGRPTFLRQPVEFCGMLASRLRNFLRRPVKPYLCDPGWEAELHTEPGQPLNPAPRPWPGAGLG
jgi:hypothetical protein